MHHRHIYISSNPSRQVAGITGMPGVARAVSSITDPPGSSGQTFAVSSYGAVGDGVVDDTAAIVSALDAAGTWSASNGGTRATVTMDASTYKVIPTGYLEFMMWENNAGTWRYYNDANTYHIVNYDPTATTTSDYGAISGDYAIHQTKDNLWLLTGTTWARDYSGNPAWYVPETEQVGTWHFQETDPTAGNGVDGDHWINKNEDAVWLKTAGSWAVESVCIEGSGTGWSTGFDSPSGGSAGDIYLQYRLKTTAPFIIQQAWNNVTIKGAGKALTKLLYKCWGDISPDDYTIGATQDDVTQTKIPPKLFYPAGSSSAGPNDTRANRTSRTPFFEWDSDGSHPGTELDGFHIEDMEMDGNATVSDYNHGWYSYGQYLDQWDIDHKGVVFSYGADGNIYNVEVSRCNMHNIRGEILYAGGGNIKQVTATDCDISYSKASAVSTSAGITCTGLTISNIYGGFENYAVNDYSQFTDISNTTINVGSGSSGSGIVYIGGGDGATYLNITNVTSTGGLSGLFMSESALDVTINGFTVVDATYGIFAQYDNFYNYTGENQFKDISISNLTLKATADNMTYGIYPSDPSWANGDNWTVDSVTITEENGFNVGTSAFINTNNSTVDLTVSNSDISAIPKAYTGNGKKPLWTSVTSDRHSINTFTASSGTYTWDGGSPKYKVSFIPDQTAPGKTGRCVNLVPNDITEYPTGHEAEISLALTEATESTMWFLQDAAWNNFTQDYEITQNDAFVMTMNANGKFDYTSLTVDAYA